MATRSSINNQKKTKSGAVASLAVGGIALGTDAGASDPLGANGNALLESAFRLLEEGQNLFLAQDDSPTQSPGRIKLDVHVAPLGGAETGPHPVQAVSAEAPVADIAVLQAVGPDIVLAQADAAALNPGSTSSAASAGTGVSASSVAAAVEAVSSTVAAASAAPLATLVGVGAIATTVVAVAVDNSSSAGSDLNDDQNDAIASDTAKLFSLSGASDSHETPGTATGAGLIGGSSFIDDSSHSFFS